MLQPIYFERVSQLNQLNFRVQVVTNLLSLNKHNTIINKVKLILELYLK